MKIYEILTEENIGKTYRVKLDNLPSFLVSEYCGRDFEVVRNGHGYIGIRDLIVGTHPIDSSLIMVLEFEELLKQF